LGPSGYSLAVGTLLGTVPSLIGDTQAQASAVLTAAGLALGTVSYEQPGPTARFNGRSSVSCLSGGLADILPSRDAEMRGAWWARRALVTS